MNIGLSVRYVVECVSSNPTQLPKDMAKKKKKGFKCPKVVILLAAQIILSACVCEK